jgi:hypothetical protein
VNLRLDAVLKLLFWNVDKKPRQEIVASLAAQHEVDVLILAECDVPDQVLLPALNADVASPFHPTFSRCESVRVFTRLTPDSMTTIFDDEGGSWTIRRVRCPSGTEVLLVAAHAVSKLYRSAESQTHRCITFAERVREFEERAGHTRTVLVGDLNMDPFESGIVSAVGLHAVMTRQKAAKKERTVNGTKYPFFFNPMWGRFGDRPDGPPGTYYRDRGEEVEHFWHIYDQVLVRPELLEAFRDQDLRIVTSCGQTSLVSRAGRPNRKVASDHLPIVFSLDL